MKYASLWITIQFKNMVLLVVLAEVSKNNCKNYSTEGLASGCTNSSGH